jgi:hypothetical protein
MAESDSILQLGIEAARDGNREEARNLFRLLTRQDPSNAQAWLWLAGVAENRDERQAALERVVELDPDNEMAIKGLQALGVRSNARSRQESPNSSVVPSDVPDDDFSTSLNVDDDFAPSTPAAPAEPDRSRYDFDDDDPYAQFDTLSEAMAEAPTAVRRNESSDEIDQFDDLSNELNNEAASSPRRASSSSRRSNANSGGTSGYSTSSSSSRRNNRYADDDAATVPARKGPSPILLAVAGLLVLLLLCWGAWSLFGGSNNVAENPAAPTSEMGAGGDVEQPTAEGEEPTAEGEEPTAEGEVPPAEGEQPPAEGEVPPAEGEQPPAEGEQPPAEGEQPPAEGEQPPVVSAEDAQIAAAQPALVAPGTPLSANGWQYDFNQPNYAVQLGGLNGIQPQGRLVMVLVFIANNTGSPQAIPADLFVLKDAQGRVYHANPAASSAYVQRGINADLSHEDQIPSDGLIRSVPIVFDVQPDATDLTFLSRGNTSQGWVVLSGVQ